MQQFALKMEIVIYIHVLKNIFCISNAAGNTDIILIQNRGQNRTKKNKHTHQIQNKTLKTLKH